MLAVGSRFFAIKDIKVTGNVSIASSEIIEVVSIYYDKNLLRIKQESVRLRLAETLPIEEVKVSYKLPGTLLINVKERDIAAALHYFGGFALIDESGVVVKIEQKLTNYPVPIITGVNVQEARVAATPVIDNKDTSYDTLLNLIGLLKYMASELSEVNVKTDEYGDAVFCLYTIDGYQINLGKFDKAKVAIIKDILDDIRENVRGKGILDLSHNAPIFKPLN